MKRALVTAAALTVSLAAHADWDYSNRADEMSGKTTHTASTTSVNSLSLSLTLPLFSGSHS
jgi:hypothetical protein